MAPLCSIYLFYFLRGRVTELKECRPNIYVRVMILCLRVIFELNEFEFFLFCNNLSSLQLKATASQVWS